jgi:uncharacterized protein
LADKSWRDRPAVMDRRTWRAAAQRMAEHAARHEMASIRLVLHGGEPLLAGADRLGELVDDLRAAFAGPCRLDLLIQTNGVLLDEPMLAVLRRLEVRVGVSLDGTAQDNDRRRRAAGRVGKPRGGRPSPAAADRVAAP